MFGTMFRPSGIFDLQDIQCWDFRHHLRQQSWLGGGAEDVGHALRVVLDVPLPAAGVAARAPMEMMISQQNQWRCWSQFSPRKMWISPRKMGFEARTHRV